MESQIHFYWEMNRCFIRRQYSNLIKAIAQSIVVMAYNLFQSNVNPALPLLLVNLVCRIVILMSQSDKPLLKNCIHSHQTEYQSYNFSLKKKLKVWDSNSLNFPLPQRWRKFVHVFWEDLYDWLFPKLSNLSILIKENVLYGISIKESSHDLAINTLIILGQFIFTYK